MPNMNYCPFANTLDDMIDCNESITDFCENLESLSESLKSNTKALEQVKESIGTEELEAMEAMERMHYLVNEMKLGFQELNIQMEECL